MTRKKTISRSDIVIDSFGVLEVGNGTPFANPFIANMPLKSELVSMLDRADKERYFIYKATLTPRDTYSLYFKYILHPMVNTKSVFLKLLTVKKFNCDCRKGFWCHANVFTETFLEKNDISEEPLSNEILDRIKGRRNRRKRT